MKILIKILKIILSIILMVSISILIFINLATSTILSKEYILNKFEETGYYAKIKEEAKSSFENYIPQSGFEENVMENIISDEKIKNDTKIIISNIYDGTNQTVDTTEIEDKLRNNIKESLGNTKINTVQQNSIDQYVETICNEYKEKISHTKYETNINNILNKLNKIVDMAKKISIITIAIMVVIILIVNCKNIIKAISQLGTVLTANGIFYIIVNLFINSKIKIENLLILNNSISEVIRKIITDIFDKIMNYGLILLVCGFILIIVSNAINAKKIESNSSRE